MTKFSFLILALFLTTTFFAQKVMEKQLDISGIARIDFQANGIYKLKIVTATTSTLTLKASIAGDYAEQVVLDIKQDDNALTIIPGYMPFFKKDNDKLAAHKVQAIELDVIVPENLSVAIDSNLASVYGFGNFKYFQAYLVDGTCTLKNFKGDGYIQTKNGNVVVATLPEVGITANSQTGKIIGNSGSKHFYKLEINTLSGGITILETN